MIPRKRPGRGNVASRTLILGGVRSGKSRLAASLAAASGLDVTVVATAMAPDEDLQLRIAAYRARRPARWQLVEEPIALAGVLRAQAGERRLLLVDGLSGWLGNLLEHPDPRRWSAERDDLLVSLAQLPGHLLLVGNESGLGDAAPGGAPCRLRDEAGWLNQELARRCERVVFTVAGLPQVLKGPPWIAHA
jgi:adenosylcobinamide kinase/adenosylcobinamide-phosphate guanylyltransferase